MTLDSLLKAFRKAFQQASQQNQSERPQGDQEDGSSLPSDQKTSGSGAPANDRQETVDDEALDPFNPFPDPVVLEIGDVLDLHSIPPKQVRAVVEEYVREARKRGFRYLRIIHGKGIGVQREMVRSILSKTPFVIEYKDAPAEAGGWGATIVELNVKKEE